MVVFLNEIIIVDFNSNSIHTPPGIPSHNKFVRSHIKFGFCILATLILSIEILNNNQQKNSL